MKHALVIFAALTFAAASLRAGDMKSLAIGEEVPLFTLKNHDGKEYDLKKILGENKYAVVMFVATECPVSNAYNERMARLHETYSAKGVAILGVNANKAESTEDIASHAKEHNFKFPVLKDEKNKVADLYGARVTPEVYVIDGKGKLLYHGRIDDDRKGKNIQSNDLVDALDALLSGKAVQKTETKAMGCTIKRVVES